MKQQNHTLRCSKKTFTAASLLTVFAFSILCHFTFEVEENTNFASDPLIQPLLPPFDEPTATAADVSHQNQIGNVPPRVAGASEFMGNKRPLKASTINTSSTIPRIQVILLRAIGIPYHLDIILNSH